MAPTISPQPALPLAHVPLTGPEAVVPPDAQAQPEHSDAPYAGQPYADHPYRPGPQAPARRWVRVPVRTRAIKPVELGVLGAAIVGLDVLLWKHVGGFGCAAALLGGMGMALAARGKRRASVRAGVMGVVLAALAARAAWDFHGGVLLLGVLSLVGFAIALRRRSMHAAEPLLALGIGIAAIHTRLGALRRGIAPYVPERLSKQSVLPVLVPLALVLVFGAVFGLANPVVAHALVVVRDWAAQFVEASMVLRVVFWSMCALGTLAVLRPSMRPVRVTKSMDLSDEYSSVSLAIARNAIVILNVMFLAYNAMDGMMLWAGRLPAGMDTQHYAHAGAFWLTVALGLVTATLGYFFRGPLAVAQGAKGVRTLAYVWVAQSGVLALGTFRRIWLHIDTSGLSNLRIVGIFGTSLVCVGLGLVMLKLRTRKSMGWLVARKLDALALATVVYAVLPTHLISARFDVARIMTGELRPVVHLDELSREAEGAPELLPLLDHPDARVRDGAAALLAAASPPDMAPPAASWQARDVASTRRFRLLAANRAKIAAAEDPTIRDTAKGALQRLSDHVNYGRELDR